MVIEVSVTEALKKSLKEVYRLGLEVDKQGSIILDETMAFHRISKALEEYGIVYTSIRDALDRYSDIVERYGLKLFNIDKRSFDNGILLYVPKNTRLVDPVYTCYTLASKGFVQRVYNLLVLEEGSEAVSVTGCLSIVPEGVHSSITETYIGRNARLYMIMVHNWMPEVVMGTVKRVRLMENAQYYDYYVNLVPPKSMGFTIELYLEGENSSVSSNTILVGRRDSRMVYTTRAYLEAPGSSAELVSRMLGEDSSRVVSRATIVAKAEDTRGHIECQGLQLSNKAVLSTTPTLESYVENTRLTHEASIGRISEDELEYLISHGFTEDEAVSIIVRGFLELGVEKVPSKLRLLIQQTLDRLVGASM